MAAHILRKPVSSPRGLTVQQAAAFAGVTADAYRQASEIGDYPGPTLWGGRVDRKLLERHMDRLSGILPAAEVIDPLEDWERRRDARRS